MVLVTFAIGVTPVAAVAQVVEGRALDAASDSAVGGVSLALVDSAGVVVAAGVSYRLLSGSARGTVWWWSSAFRPRPSSFRVFRSWPVTDGAPVGRFVRRLHELMTEADGLDDGTMAGGDASPSPA